MWRTLRIVLTWLLALALPVQGFAAATMTHCGSQHDGSIAAHAHVRHVHEPGVDGATAPHHGHDEAAPHSHGHDDGAVAGDHEAAPAADLHKLTKTSCSACASCCTAAALPSTIVTFEASPVHDAVITVLPLAAVAFLTGGPERPPRSVLA